MAPGPPKAAQRPLAVVTGAASGIGYAVSRRLLTDGWQVVGLDIHKAKTTDHLLNTRLTAVEADVTDLESVHEAFDRLPTSPAFVVNAAGVVAFTRTGGPGDIESFQRLINVNLLGTYLVARAAIEHNAETLVNVASAAWNQGQAYMAAYAASKAGVVALTRSLALEFLKSDIVIAAVAPGAVDTSILEHVEVPPDLDGELVNRYTPTRPMLHADDVASVVCSIHGQPGFHGCVVPFDAGMTAD